VGVTGSANIPPALIVRMRDTFGLDAVHAGYGLTEATGVCTMTRADDPLALVTETSGRAIPGVEVRVVAPDDEIEVRGVGVMLGYLDDPDATAAVMRPGGWLATGDVGALDADGNLSILDRLHDLVIVGGFNVYPAEIERVLAEHPAVAQAAVVGVPDDARGEIPVAFVIPSATATDTRADALLAFVRERLASYKVPRHVWLVDELPLTPVPKVDKVALAADARARLGLSDR
jgi:acyl-CoA synthetase (AMP-forming)/AMP-acid ligase II